MDNFQENPKTNLTYRHNPFDLSSRRSLQQSLQTKNCSVSYLPPDGAPVPRICKHHVSTCAAAWWPSSAEGCSGPAEYVYTKEGEVYRNIQCALCNKEVDTDLHCVQPPPPLILPVEEVDPENPEAILNPEGEDPEEWGSGSGYRQSYSREEDSQMWYSQSDPVRQQVAPASIRILLDMNRGEVETLTPGELSLIDGYAMSECPDNAIYDIYKGKCRELFCRDGYSMNEQGQCMDEDVSIVHVKPQGKVNALPPDSGLSFGPLNVDPDGGDNVHDSDCTLVRLDQSEYDLHSNGSVYVETLDVVLEAGEFVSVDNNSIAVCSDLFNSSSSGHSYIKVSLQTNLVEDYLSLAGQLLSLVSLLVMFAVYCSLKPLRNLPGKCLLSLAIALFLAQLLFLFLVVPTPESWPCWLLATSTHYFFLAAFFWMNTMAFDIWRTFQFQMLSQSSQNTRRRFIGYSLYAWITPLVVVAVAVLSDVDMIPLPDYLRPHYARTFCWLNNKWGLLVFFAVPIAVLLLFNIVFFLMTVVSICRASQATKFLSKGQRLSKRSHLVLYVKLSAVMGLTWVFGYLANSSQHHAQIMWYLFIVFSSLQGFVICIGFVCNRRVVRLLRERCQRRKKRSMRSMSATAGSSPHTGMTSAG